MTGDAIATRLARNVRAISHERLTPLARSRAMIGIVDTIAVTLGGVTEDCVALLAQMPGIAETEGESTLIGATRRVSMLDAALINGTASHAQDYDDFSAVFGGHQSAPLVAPLFALAEAEAKSGRDLVTAYAAGVELETRLARSVHWHHYDKGWHPTATLGTIGAAGACAHLMGLDEERIATALCIAVSHSAGVKANFGSMTKPLHVGQACRSGLLSALLARQGFTAGRHAFEHSQGFFEVFNGAGNFDSDKPFENWGNPWELEDPGLALKLWPCCGSTHAAVAAALDLREEEKVEIADIAQIVVLPHPRRLKHTNTPRPVTPLQAKFSVQYVTARALADGAVTLADFEPEAISDPRIARLLDRLEARPLPDLGSGPEAQWTAEVIVKMVDGSTVSRRIENFTSDPRVMPPSVSELEGKFANCAGTVLAEKDIAAVFEQMKTFDSIADMRAVGQMLMASRRSASLVAR